MITGKLIGIITDRDMTKRVIADGYELNAPIKSVMTANPTTVSPNDLVLHAASLMMQHNIRSLPVVEEGKVVNQTAILIPIHLAVLNVAI